MLPGLKRRDFLRASVAGALAAAVAPRARSLDAEVIDEYALQLQRLDDKYPPRNEDEVRDLLFQLFKDA